MDRRGVERLELEVEDEDDELIVEERFVRFEDVDVPAEDDADLIDRTLLEDVDGVMFGCGLDDWDDGVGFLADAGRTAVRWAGTADGADGADEVEGALERFITHEAIVN